MKVNELRVGNYVYAGNDGYVLQFISAFGLCNLETRPNGFSPIPLTEEWLVKFGFIKETAWYRIGKHAVNPTIAYLYEFKNIPILEIEYVHQLQNLYFALTGEELTIKQ